MATRMYFRENGTAPLSPAFASWSATSAPAARIPMFRTTSGADALTTVGSFNSTQPATRLFRQIIGEAMAAGNTFDNTVTWKCYVQVLEGAADDNLIAWLTLRVCDSSGTYQHTIFSLGDHSSGAEFNTSLRNKAYLDGDAGGGSYVTAEGDRLVLEIGYRNSTGGSATASVRMGSDGASDLPENETDTSTTKNPWLECSLDVTFAGEGATPVSAATIGDFAVEWWLVSADENDRLPVWPISGECGHDGLMNGTAVLEFAADDQAVEVFKGATHGQEFPEVTLRVFLRGQLRWIGPVEVAKLSHKGDIRSGRVVITVPHMWQHLHTRRTLMGDSSLGTADATASGDDLVKKLQRNNIAGSVITPTSPAYPATRTDFGSFLPAVAADRSEAPSTRIVGQSGNNLLEAVSHLIEHHDLRPEITVSGQAYTLDCRYPFERDDKTDTVVFSPYRGNLRDFEYISSRAALANLWLLEGEDSTTRVFAEDEASQTLWGVFEAYAQKPQDSAVSADASNEASRLKDRWGGAEQIYKAGLAEITGMIFGVDFWWGDKVLIDEHVYGIAIEQVITGWKVQQSEGRVHRLDLTAGPPKPRNQLSRMSMYVGRDGPENAGSLWRNKRQ